MNRQHAEHILDAYVLIIADKASKASDALREVILDVMASRSEPTTLPSITIPTTNYPTNWDDTPKITCSTGIGPAFRTNTEEAVE